MNKTHGSLFSGFDAPSIAASWMGWKNAFHCEINSFCNEILKYWFPDSEHYEDITKTDFSQWKGRIDVLTGGFPCQPFSLAGQRKGADDNRYLWPHMLRAIREIRPAWVIGENVAGILTMVQPGKETEVGSQTSLFGEDNRKRILLRQEYVVETICKDLEREGYSVQPLLIPACAVGAPHRRDRVWFVAHRTDSRTEDVRQEREDKVLSDGIAPNTNGYGYLSSRTCEESERCRCRNDGESEKRKQSTEWSNGLHGFSRDASDPQCSGSGQIQQEIQSEQPNGYCIDSNGSKRNVAYSYSELLQYRNSGGQEGRNSEKKPIEPPYCPEDWSRFPTQSPVCGGNDGVSFNVDNLTIPFTKWRQESVKGYGNAIVPQVILEIFKAIEEIEQLE
jgi:site-specific DNA-cytosine methylase